MLTVAGGILTAEQVRRIEEDGGKRFRAVVMSMSMSSQSAHCAVQNADGLELMTDGRVQSLLD